MSDMPRVAVVGDFRFPFGDAAANRIFALAKALRESGWRPMVVSRGRPRAEDRLENHYVLDGVEYIPYADISSRSFLRRLRRPEAELDRIARSGRLDAVLVYASTSWPFVPGLIRYCRIKKLPLAADVVEWYEPSQYAYGLFDWRYFLFEFSFRVFFPRIRRMIVISRLLEDTFGRKGCRTVRVPAIVDCSAVRYTQSPRTGKLRLIYAGVPGRKDKISEALGGLLLLTDEEMKAVQFDLLGPDEEQLAALQGDGFPERLKQTVHAHGCVPVQAVSEWLLLSDFTVLLRENRRFARAGFPSKVPESLAHGVPVLCNMTGDMALYLKDGRECVEVAAPTAEAFAEALRRALSLPAERIVEMKRYARRRAEEDFDYRNYTSALAGVLEGARRDMGGQG
jgi:glycosyltransferase involved in cell wall biosynthesis